MTSSLGNNDISLLSAYSLAMGRPLSAGGDGLLANNSLKSFGLFSLTITPLPLPSLPARLSFFVHRFLAFGNFFFLTNSLVTGLAFERDFLLLRGAILLIKRDAPSPSKNVDAEIAWNRIANRHRQEWSCFILGQTWMLDSLGVLQRSPQQGRRKWCSLPYATRKKTCQVDPRDSAKSVKKLKCAWH